MVLPLLIIAGGVGTLFFIKGKETITETTGGIEDILKATIPILLLLIIGWIIMKKVK